MHLWARRGAVNRVSRLTSLLFVFLPWVLRSQSSGRVPPSPLRLTRRSAGTFDQLGRVETRLGKHHHSDTGGGKKEGMETLIHPRRFLPLRNSLQRSEQQLKDRFGASSGAPESSDLKEKLGRLDVDWKVFFHLFKEKVLSERRLQIYFTELTWLRTRSYPWKSEQEQSC